MSGPRPPRPEPVRPGGTRSGRELASILDSIRTARTLAVVALVVGVVGLGLAAWRFLSPAGGTACQGTAWDADPATGDLPSGWTISATQFDVNRMNMTLLGPAPADETTTQAVVYATVTCFPDDAAGAVTRSQQAATTAGQSVTGRSDLGDQGFTALDGSGAVFVQFRRGDVVAYLAASGDATLDEVDAVAGAFERALGGDGVVTAVGTLEPPASGEASPSEVAEDSSEPEPSDSPAAPELVAVLPATLNGTELVTDSAVGEGILGNDPASRALAAALRNVGSSPSDLRVAQAYDPSEASDLSLLAFRVPGIKGDALATMVLDSWLAANAPGVKAEAVTIGGHEATRVDYGDESSLAWVIRKGDIVIEIETSDADLAAQAAAALP